MWSACLYSEIYDLDWFLWTIATWLYLKIINIKEYFITSFLSKIVPWSSSNAMHLLIFIILIFITGNSSHQKAQLCDRVPAGCWGSDFSLLLTILLQIGRSCNLVNGSVHYLFRKKNQNILNTSLTMICVNILLVLSKNGH